MANVNNIYLNNNFLEVSSFKKNEKTEDTTCLVATIVNNMAKFGYMPNKDVFNALNELSKEDLVSFWKVAEKNFAEETKQDKNMDEFVV